MHLKNLQFIIFLSSLQIWKNLSIALVSAYMQLTRKTVYLSRRWGLSQELCSWYTLSA
jgi:hypothetical protein